MGGWVGAVRHLPWLARALALAGAGLAGYFGWAVNHGKACVRTSEAAAAQQGDKGPQRSRCTRSASLPWVCRTPLLTADADRLSASGLLALWRAFSALLEPQGREERLHGAWQAPAGWLVDAASWGRGPVDALLCACSAVGPAPDAGCSPQVGGGGMLPQAKGMNGEEEESEEEDDRCAPAPPCPLSCATSRGNFLRLYRQGRCAECAHANSAEHVRCNPASAGTAGLITRDSIPPARSEGGGTVRVAGRKTHKRRKTGSGKEVRQAGLAGCYVECVRLPRRPCVLVASYCLDGWPRSGLL